MPDFQDPAKEAEALRHVEELAGPTPIAAPVTEPHPLTTTAAADTAKPLSPETATGLFPHLTDPAPAADPGLVPHRVKTTTIKNDPAAMLDAIAAANNNLRKESDRPQARTTAGNLLNEAGADGLTGMNQFAYILATVERESRGGTSMNEEYGGANRDAHFEKKYGPTSSRAHALGNTHKGDGALYPGRGLVQLTGRTNYENWTRRLAREGVQHDGAAPDLVNHPELAADPALATKIAIEGMRDGSFTGARLGRYVNDQKTDYVNARRVINGQDAAEEIAERARTYEGILKGHSNEFYGSMLASQENKLPTAREAAPLTPISGDLSGLLGHTPLGNGNEHFGPVKDLFNKPLGQFKPVPANKKEKITNIVPHRDHPPDLTHE